MVVWSDRERERTGSGWLPLGLAFLAGALAMAVAQRCFPELLGDSVRSRPAQTRPASRAVGPAPVHLSWGPRLPGDAP